MQEQHKRSEAVIQSLRSEVEDGKRMISEQDLAIREAHGERNIAIQNHSPCETKIAALKKQLSGLEVSFDSLQKEHSPCAALIEQLQTQNAELQNEAREFLDLNMMVGLHCLFFFRCYYPSRANDLKHSMQVSEMAKIRLQASKLR